MIDAHEYMMNNSTDRDDLADLEPSECLFIHHKTATSFTASMHSGCAICNESYEWKNINIPSWLQEHEEDSECYVSVFKAEIDLKNDSFSIRILAKTDCGINSSFVNIAVKGGKKSNHEHGNYVPQIMKKLIVYGKISNLIGT